MLRVAHVLNSPGRGGVPRVAHALVRHADRARIAPHVFYLKTGEGADPFDDSDIPRRTATAASKASAMTELVAFLDAHQIDILHSHWYRPNLYARMAGAVLRPAGLRIIAHYHNDYSEKWTGDILNLERRLAAVTDAGIAVSDAVADHVNRQIGLTPEIVMNGIDTDRVTNSNREAGRRALGFATNEFAVGLIGRVCRQKGVDTFVEAAIRICALTPRTRFAVIGAPESPDLLKTLCHRIASAGLSDRISFEGHREDMADVFAALDLLAAPSRWEGFGLMLAEAMASGLPAVASHVGGMPAVAGGAARFIPPDDAGALADAIASLLRDPIKRRAMRAAGLNQANRFDWSQSAVKVEALYNRLVAQR